MANQSTEHDGLVQEIIALGHTKKEQGRDKKGKILHKRNWINDPIPDPSAEVNLVFNLSKPR